MARRPILPVAMGGLLALAALLLGLAGPDSAQALPEWVHANATACGDCHHNEPVSSFAPCADCHPNPRVPNRECRDCHTNKITTGIACWTHHEPGQDMPPPTQENCIACHTTTPHPFSYLGSDPACTVCHGTDPTPHHDAVNQVAPSTCTDCHTTETHNGLDCTNCHSETQHPSYPTVPDTCFSCHDPDVFGGQRSCLTCHYGAANFGGVGDDDIHDPSIPDPPISGTSCRSCHPNANKHAGQVDCVECHTTATPYHHNRASSPGYPACQQCHGNPPQHGNGLDCQRCHVNAQHQVDPPTPGPANCTICHDVPRFAVNNCYGCHRPPIYHQSNPQVPGCNSHHGPFQIHDSLSSCEDCHTNPASGHHRGSVNIPDCRSCHEQNYHVGQITCGRCHRNAQHDRTPLNLPTPVWDVCLQCHPFAAKAPACNECHDETQHSATYRVPDDCNACHDNKPHAGKVDCRLCHLRIESGHHDDGEVTARDCSNCHVTAEVHALETEGGTGFGCDTCHEGGVHGTQQLPDRERCLDCHEDAEDHAGELECIQCHWPAAHDATPSAGEFGSYEPLALRLPAPVGDETIDERAEFTFTGYDALVQLAFGLGLLLLGLILRSMSAVEDR